MEGAFIGGNWGRRWTQLGYESDLIDVQAAIPNALLANREQVAQHKGG